MTTPNFIGIGAQKCATTWLYDLLELHPQVGLSSVKEIHFFSQYYGYGLQWYQSHFSEVEPNLPCVGEFSTTYFCDYDAPKRIKQCYPDSKIVLMLRDPIERLISNHKHEIRIGHLTGPDFSVEAGIKNNSTYIEQGMYATHLERWLEFFERDQIHIVFYDQVKSNPAEVEKELYAFFGVDDVVHYDLLSKSNPSYVYRSKGLENVRRNVIKAVKSLKLEPVYRWAVNKSGLQSAYRKANRNSSSELVPELLSETKDSLVNIFSPEIEKLEKSLSVDLEQWKKK